MHGLAASLAESMADSDDGMLADMASAADQDRPQPEAQASSGGSPTPAADTAEVPPLGLVSSSRERSGTSVNTSVAEDILRVSRWVLVGIFCLLLVLGPHYANSLVPVTRHKQDSDSDDLDFDMSRANQVCQESRSVGLVFISFAVSHP